MWIPWHNMKEEILHLVLTPGFHCYTEKYFHQKDKFILEKKIHILLFFLILLSWYVISQYSIMILDHDTRSQYVSSRCVRLFKKKEFEIVFFFCPLHNNIQLGPFTCLFMSRSGLCVCSPSHNSICERGRSFTRGCGRGQAVIAGCNNKKNQNTSAYWVFFVVVFFMLKWILIYWQKTSRVPIF